MRQLLPLLLTTAMALCSPAVSLAQADGPRPTAGPQAA